MQLQLRLETFDRHVDAALGEPGEVGCRRVWRCRIWWHPPLASPDEFLHARPRRFVQIEQRLPVLGHERVDIDQLRDKVARAIGDASRDHAAIAMADQHDVTQIFIFDDVEDVLNMSLQVDRRVRQMYAFADTGVGWGDEAMSGRVQSMDASSSTPTLPTTRRGRPENSFP